MCFAVIGAHSMAESFCFQGGCSALNTYIGHDASHLASASEKAALKQEPSFLVAQTAVASEEACGPVRKGSSTGQVRAHSLKLFSSAVQC